MKIFEFYFNPRAKGDRFFDTLTEEPKQSSLGNLYTAGELTNALPQHAKFLHNTASFLKEAFYSTGPKNTLQKAVTTLNELLRKEIKQGNVSWLGNLHFAALNIRADTKGRQTLVFTKAGNIKVLIQRNAKLSDMDKDIAKSGIESFGAKIFGNIVSGQISPRDKIFVITKDLFDVLAKEKMIADFTFVEKAKQFQRLFKNKEKELSNISGILFAIFIEEVPKKKVRTTSFAQNLVAAAIRKKAPLPFVFSKFSFSKQISMKLPFGPKLILIALFLFLLIVGAIVFKDDREKLVQEAILTKERAVSLQIEAQNAQSRDRENILLQEAWRTVVPQTKRGKPKRSEFLLLKQEIEERLNELNKIEEIASPQSIFAIKKSEIGFVPKRMVLSSDNEIYLFNPFRSFVYKLNFKSAQGQRLSTERNIKLGTKFQDSVVFYAEPGVLLSQTPEQTWQEIPLRIPYPNADFDALKSFENSLYFFDSKAREIIKYGNLDFEQAFLSGKLWLNSETAQKPGGAGAHSIAIDGNIWVLQNGKEVQRYFGGVLKETIKPIIFPFLENVSRIHTASSLPNLYLLDSFGKRLIILTKFGEVVKQYESPKFKAVVDFAVSADGRSVYLLSDTDIYKIDVSSSIL